MTKAVLNIELLRNFKLDDESRRHLSNFLLIMVTIKLFTISIEIKNDKKSNSPTSLKIQTAQKTITE
jgi:hypothetical protein